ncbi:MAG: LacI family transcriptional regulator [Treponema sp.]|nr:LacI family transcriptional regulator [Treponema sp.]
MITLKEIAERCGVSIATVSNILNGKTNFSEETKERILEVIKETGYRPNYMARTLRAHKTNTIGIIVDDVIDFSAPNLIDGLMGYCEGKGYKIVLENIRFYYKTANIWKSHDEYKEAVNKAIQEMSVIKVDGIIYIAAHSRNIDCIPKNLDIPFVISYAYDDLETPCVVFDDEKAGFDMTEYLISKGHSKIALIMGNKDSIHTLDRFKGFTKAMKKHSLPVNEKWQYYGNWNLESGYDACKNLFESKELPSAIFSFNDIMAYGVYKCLSEKNLRPGKDISVVGFDNREVSRFMTPELTTIYIPLREIGEKSADTLIRIINGESVEQKIALPCSLIERDSVCDIN